MIGPRIANALFTAALCILLLSSCALKQSKRPRIKLDRALILLPTLNNASALIAAMGEPDSRARFNHDDLTGDFMDRMPLSFWQKSNVTWPLGLFDTLPVGTKLFQYQFVLQYDVINPWINVLQVCVDDNDQIVGWMYATAYVGREKTSWLR